MRRCVWAWLVGAALFCPTGAALAQNSIDAVIQDLKEAKQAHEEDTAKTLSVFFTEVDAAMANPDQALALYKQAKGDMPTPVPVVSEHDSETASERDERLALDSANLTRLATALQLHCGLMHFAAVFVIKPKQAGLHDQWIAWLKTAAQAYPSLAPPPDAPAPPADTPKKKHFSDDRPPPGVQRPPPFYPEGLRGTAVRDSAIARYLGFKAWNDKEQGGWSIRSIPQLYRDQVLEPLRKKPTNDTLVAWDVFIAMANADERDNNRWDDDVYPPLQFDRAVDAYLVSPSTEGLEGLVNLIKSNKSYAHVDDWIARVSKLVRNYRNHGQGDADTDDSTADAPPAADNSSSNVTVTTEQQGDATIVTTHTNTPASNAPTGTRPAMGAAPVMNMQSVMNAAPVIGPRPIRTNAPPVAPQQPYSPQ